MSSLTPRRFWSLDVLRGLCALIVFLTHWVLWAKFTPKAGVESGLQTFLVGCTRWFQWLAWPTGANHPAVICFFILSGFCIHHGCIRHVNAGTEPNWREFFRRRFLRIMPVYWTAALLGFALVTLHLLRPTTEGVLVLHTAATRLHLVVRLLGVSDLYPAEILAGNGPLSTVGIELLLYCAYPFFFRFVARGSWLGLMLVFLGLESIGMALLSYLNPVWVYNSVLMYGVFWCAGAFTAHHYATRGTRSHVRELVGTWVVFLVLNSLPHFTGLSVLKQNVFGVVCVFGVLQCLHLERTHAQLGAARMVAALQYVSDVSYTLYAVHTPAILIGTWTLIQLGQVNYSVQLVTTFTTSAIAMVVVHYGIERVFYRPRALASPVNQTASQPVAA